MGISDTRRRTGLFWWWSLLIHAYSHQLENRTFCAPLLKVIHIRSDQVKHGSERFRCVSAGERGGIHVAIPIRLNCDYVEGTFCWVVKDCHHWLVVHISLCFITRKRRSVTHPSRTYSLGRWFVTSSSHSAGYRSPFFRGICMTVFTSPWERLILNMTYVRVLFQYSGHSLPPGKDMASVSFVSFDFMPSGSYRICDLRQI